MTVVVLGLDGLGAKWIEKYRLSALKQENYTITDLSDYRGSHPYTPVIWTAMIRGKIDREMEEIFLEHTRGKKPIRPLLNLSKRLLPLRLRRRLGYLYDNIFSPNVNPPMTITADWCERKDMETILDGVDSWQTTVPGYNGVPRHEERMEIIKRALAGDESMIPFYDKGIIEEYEGRKGKLLSFLESDNQSELVFFYTNYLDALGHLHFADSVKRMHYYFELNDLCAKVKEKMDDNNTLYVVSDHGMIEEDGYGSHSNHGFFSSSDGNLIDKPTDLYHLLKEELENER